MLINHIIMYTDSNKDFYIDIQQLTKFLPLIKQNIQKYNLWLTFLNIVQFQQASLFKK